MSGFAFTWITVLMVALTGFFGAGAVALYKQGHRAGSGVVVALAVVCLVIGVISGLPAPDASPR